MKITRMMLRRWGACYSDDKIASLVPESGLTPIEIAELAIPTEDRMWVLLREEIIPARDLRLLACGWADGACRAAGWDDQRSLEAIAVARRFAVGEASEAELVEAWAAAWEARSEAWFAAPFLAAASAEEAAARWSAARAARWSAAEAAAAASSSAWASAARWSAARAARWSAAEAAAAAASWAAKAAEWASASARADQLADVVRVLKG